MTATYRDTGVTYRDVTVTYRGAAPPVDPVLYVKVAFTDNPTTASADLTWTDISDFVQGLATRRGRQHELDRVEAGTLTVQLDNRDRRFDPNYAAGPYFGTLLPMRRIEVEVRWEGVTYPLFSGLVESWPQDYPDVFDAEVTLPCVDLFKGLALLGLSGTFAESLTGTRVDDVLDALGWPAADRDLDAGQSTQQETLLAGSSALAHLQDVSAGENGLFFIARDGDVTLIDRHQLILTAQDPTLVWGDDDPSYFPFVDVTFDYGDSNLWNEVTVSSTGHSDHVGEDLVSQARYFVRSLSLTTLLADEGEMQDLADFLASRFSEPALRITSMILDGQPATTWPYLLAREIGDKVQVRKTPPGGGDVIVQDSVIDGISWSIQAPSSWSCTWALSPIDAVSNYWVLGDAAQSLLGQSTQLAY